MIPNPKALLIKAFLPARNAQAQAGEAEAWERKSDPKCFKIYISSLATSANTWELRIGTPEVKMLN